MREGAGGGGGDMSLRALLMRVVWGGRGGGWITSLRGLLMRACESVCGA